MTMETAVMAAPNIRRYGIKKGIEYRDVAKEIVGILAKYKATLDDADEIMYMFRKELRSQRIVAGENEVAE